MPENAVLHIEDLALYHLDLNQYGNKIEVSEFFNKHSQVREKKTKKKNTQIEYEGTQTIDRTPVDDVLKQIAIESNNPLQPINPPS